VEGAWLSHDPAGYVDSPDLYSYAAANPIDFVDPMGAQLNVTPSSTAVYNNRNDTPDHTHSNNTIGLTPKPAWKINDIVHQNDWLLNPLGDIYNSTKSWAPPIYYAGYAATGALIGGFELMQNPVHYGLVEPATGAWSLLKASSPWYMMVDPKGALGSANGIGSGLINFAANPAEGSFQMGRGRRIVCR
jgi:hypothetical protein